MSLPKLLIISLLIIISIEGFSAQCDDVISFEAYPTDKGGANGKIELKIKEPRHEVYHFKLYRISGKVELAGEFDKIINEGVTFDKLSEGDYLVKVERNGCKIVVGGIEGIRITEKAK